VTAPHRLAFLFEPETARYALSEAETPATVTEIVRPAQIATSGSYVSRRFGRFQITESDIDRMVANFTQNEHPVRPTELCVDYDHVEGEAAGWFKKLYKKVRTDGARRVVELWADIAWVKDAAEKIAAKKYRFFSPMFDREYVTPLGKKIGITLLGGALSNRPFLQGMTSIELSARDDDSAYPAPPAASGASNMLIKAKDKDGNDIEIELDSIKDHADVKKLSQPAATASPTESKVDPNVTALVAGLTAVKDTVTKLADTIANRDKSDRKRDAEHLIDEAIRTGRLAPVDKASYLLLSETEAGMLEVRKLSGRKANSVVKLRATTAGDTHELNAGGDDDAAADDDDDPVNKGLTPENAEQRMDAAINKKMAADTKLSYDQAMNAVQAENPRLAKTFQLSFRRA
jgi:phage I-like protein